MGRKLGLKIIMHFTNSKQEISYLYNSCRTQDESEQQIVRTFNSINMGNASCFVGFYKTHFYPDLCVDIEKLAFH